MDAEEKPPVDFDALIEKHLPGALSARGGEAARIQAARRQRMAVQAMLSHELVEYANRPEGAPGDGLVLVERLARILRTLAEGLGETREHRMEFVVTRHTVRAEAAPAEPRTETPRAAAQPAAPRPPKRSAHDQKAFEQWRCDQIFELPEVMFHDTKGVLNKDAQFHSWCSGNPLWETIAKFGLRPWTGRVGPYASMREACIAWEWPEPPGESAAPAAPAPIRAPAPRAWQPG
jgi:hypothetical protein